VWHMGMRPIAPASPSACGSAGGDSTRFCGAIHDSQVLRPGLSAGDADGHGRRESGPESGAVGAIPSLSPIRLSQSRVSPRVAVG